MSHSRLHQIHGSTLISAALFAGILSILVAGLLTYLSNEYILNQQSHLWNQALHLSEAATEIAFAELDYQYWQSSTGFTTSRGWTNLGGNAYSKTIQSFTNGTGKVIGSMSIIVSNVTGNPMVTAVGTATNTTGHVPVVSRGVLTTFYKSSHFPVSLMSKVQMNMNGNNVYVDSYDSSDVTKSTGGLYDATKRQANGNIASDGTFVNTLNIGNADIYGVAYTGVGGTVALGPNGTVGPTLVTSDRATTAAAGLANGWIQNDFSVDVPSVVLPPDAVWSSKPAGTTGTGNGSITKSITLNGGDYVVDSVTLNQSSGGDQLTIAGNVRLYVTGGFDVSSSGRLVINAGSSLTVYIGGTVKVTGQAWINNAGTPDKNVWFALDTSTDWTIAGNGTFNGAIYAPNATVKFAGGGSNGDSSGAVVANKITLTGNTKFHYDQNLKNAQTGAGYSVVSWQELRKSGNSWVR